MPLKHIPDRFMRHRFIGFCAGNDHMDVYVDVMRNKPVKREGLKPVSDYQARMKQQFGLFKNLFGY